jgi:hypothetical protein
MDDVAERRSLDEQDVSHVGPVAPIYPRLSIVATSNCEITGLSHPPLSVAALLTAHVLVGEAASVPDQVRDRLSPEDARAGMRRP